MIGIFDYTTLFTFLGTLCGILSIYFSMFGSLLYSLLCLMASGLFDSLDGTIARTKKNRSDFAKRYGVQLDSLSDVICFGAAPLFIGLAIAKDNMWLQVLCLIYLLTAISRLAWFNVDEEIRRTKETTARKYYTGLPVTPAALIFPTVYLLFHNFTDVFAYIYIASMIIVAIMQISKLKVPHLKGKGEIICVIYGIILLGALLHFCM